MVVSSGDQSCPRWRAQRGRVILVVAKASVRHTLEVGSLDGSAKRAARSEAHVVCQDQENVGGPRRRLYALWKIGDRSLQSAFNCPLKRRFGSRQYRIRSSIR